MYIIEGNNILPRRVRRRAPKSHWNAHLFVRPGILKITPESFHLRPSRMAQRVGNMEGFRR
jgi:hypothetical protein